MASVLTSSSKTLTSSVTQLITQWKRSFRKKTSGKWRRWRCNWWTTTKTWTTDLLVFLARYNNPVHTRLVYIPKWTDCAWSALESHGSPETFGSCTQLDGGARPCRRGLLLPVWELDRWICQHWCSLSRNHRHTRPSCTSVKSLYWIVTCLWSSHSVHLCV